MKIRGDERGVTTGDLVLALATAALLAALIHPAWSARSFRRTVDQAAADVESVRLGARAVLEREGRWPQTADPGVAPPGLGGPAPGTGPFSRSEYRMRWRTLAVVDSIVAPPEPGPPPADAPAADAAPRMMPVVRLVGAITLASPDTALLAELAIRYAADRPLVVDTLWTLILPERGPAR